MRSQLLPILTLAIFLFSSLNCWAAKTTVYLVRHAEKLTGDTDPGLTTAGRQRAKDLARVFRSADIAACFSSEFKRTKLTAKPTAVMANVAVKSHPANQERELVAQILRDFKGKNVLVVGHSNTIPSILRRLGNRASISIGEGEFDNLFIVQVDESGESSVIRLHYGVATEPQKNPDLQQTAP